MSSYLAFNRGWHYHPGFRDDETLRLQRQTANKWGLGFSTQILSPKAGPVTSVVGHRQLTLEIQLWVRQVVTTGINTEWSLFYNIWHLLENLFFHLFFEGPLPAKFAQKQWEKCEKSLYIDCTFTGACDPVGEREMWVSNARERWGGKSGMNCRTPGLWCGTPLDHSERSKLLLGSVSLLTPCSSADVTLAACEFLS